MSVPKYAIMSIFSHLRDAPCDPESCWQSADELRSSGELRTAKSYLRKAIQLDRTFLKAWLLLAQIHRETGEGTQLSCVLSIIENLDPPDWQTWFAMFLMYGELNMMEEEVFCLKQAVRIGQDDAQYWLIWAGHLFQQDDWIVAEEALYKSLELNEINEEAWLLLSECFVVRGDLEAAGQVLQAGIDRCPHSWALWVALGKCLESLEDPDGAFRVYEYVLKNNATVTEAWNNLGALVQAKGLDESPAV